MDNITNLTSKDYSSYISQSQTNNLTNQIKNSSSAEATDEEMLSACKEFEAYMVEQFLKQAQKIIKSEDSDDENGYAGYARDLQAQQYAKSISDQGNLGLAQQLYESMKKQSEAITPAQLREMKQAQTDMKTTPDDIEATADTEATAAANSESAGQV